MASHQNDTNGKAEGREEGEEFPYTGSLYCRVCKKKCKKGFCDAMAWYGNYPVGVCSACHENPEPKDVEYYDENPDEDSDDW
jgi:hypothetical protein